MTYLTEVKHKSVANLFLDILTVNWLGSLGVKILGGEGKQVELHEMNRLFVLDGV